MRATTLEVTVAAALGGDRGALEQLLATIGPFATRYCRARIGRSSGPADDVAAKVCRAVLHALPGYRVRDHSFLAFVYGIAARTVDAHLDPAGSRQLLGQLPPEQRETLVLRAVVGLSAAETAAAVGSTTAAVRLVSAPGLERVAGVTALAAPVPSPRTAPLAGDTASGNRSQTSCHHNQFHRDQECGAWR